MLIAFDVICSLNWPADVHRSTKGNSTKCHDSQQQHHLKDFNKLRADF